MLYSFLSVGWFMRAVRSMSNGATVPVDRGDIGYSGGEILCAVCTVGGEILCTVEISCTVILCQWRGDIAYMS